MSMRLVERLLTIGVLVLLFAACTELEEPLRIEEPNELPTQVVQPKTSNNLSCQETFDYFMEIAHKIEGLVGDQPIRKWGARDGLGKEVFVYVSKQESSFDRDMFTCLLYTSPSPRD